LGQNICNISAKMTMHLVEAGTLDSRKVSERNDLGREKASRVHMAMRALTDRTALHVCVAMASRCSGASTSLSAGDLGSGTSPPGFPADTEARVTAAGRLLIDCEIGGTSLLAEKNVGEKDPIMSRKVDDETLADKSGLCESRSS
jgi:hypothetical protein